MISEPEAKSAVDASRAAPNEEAAWQALAPLELAWADDVEAAAWFAWSLTNRALARERRLDVAAKVLDRWKDDLAVVMTFGGNAEAFVEMRFLNAAPVAHPFFEHLLESLGRLFDAERDPKHHFAIGQALSALARLRGRAADALCERIHRQLLALEPDHPAELYDFGLFMKTRGRFAEGVELNQRALAAGNASEAVHWNLGICATGAGMGSVAQNVWRTLKMDLALGDAGLPHGEFGMVKVRLAERPLAARDATTDDPGLEETVWVERLSPCHGRVRNATFHPVGVDFGDLVLFDGAPIGEQTVGERRVHVFPHLATLKEARRGWDIFPFVGVQPERELLSRLGFDLPGDAAIETHTESLELLCAKCADALAPQHEHGTSAARGLVEGKLCLDRRIELGKSDRALAQLLASHAEAKIWSPALALALGDERRAREETEAIARVLARRGAR